MDVSGCLAAAAAVEIWKVLLLCSGRICLMQIDIGAALGVVTIPIAGMILRVCPVDSIDAPPATTAILLRMVHSWSRV